VFFICCGYELQLIVISAECMIPLVLGCKQVVLVGDHQVRLVWLLLDMYGLIFFFSNLGLSS